MPPPADSPSASSPAQSLPSPAESSHSAPPPREPPPPPPSAHQNKTPRSLSSSTPSPKSPRRTSAAPPPHPPTASCSAPADTHSNSAAGHFEAACTPPSRRIPTQSTPPEKSRSPYPNKHARGESASRSRMPQLGRKWPRCSRFLPRFSIRQLLVRAVIKPTPFPPRQTPRAQFPRR